MYPATHSSIHEYKNETRNSQSSPRQQENVVRNPTDTTTTKTTTTAASTFNPILQPWQEGAAYRAYLQKAYPNKKIDDAFAQREWEEVAPSNQDKYLVRSDDVTSPPWPKSFAANIQRHYGTKLGQEDMLMHWEGIE